MPELPSNAKTEVTFQELQENYEGHDIGLELFDGRLMQLTNNANEDGGSMSDLIDPGVEVLNDDWPYHDETARVTGRIHAFNGTTLAQLSELWGEPDKDVHGNLSFFVEDQELCSLGITEGPHGAVIGDSHVEAKIGYGFALPGADAPFSQLILYPGESSQHMYPTPTPEAIDLRLHKMWPEQMKIVDRLLMPDDMDIDNLPRRLAAIARLLQHELAESAESREWFSIYVNSRLKLNHMWPYVVSVKDTVHFLDDETGEHWMEMSLDGPARLDIRKPRIEFLRAQSDGTVSSMVFAELPDMSSEWNGTPVGINATDILRMRGTRAHRSLVDRALQGSEANFGAAIASAGLDDGEFDDELRGVTIKPQPREHHSGDPQNIKEMRLLKDELEAIFEMIEPLTKKTYDTFEQARDVSTALTRDLGNRLIGAGICNYALMFEGEYALRTITRKDAGRSAEPGEVIIAVDADNPFAKLVHGDNFHGTFYAFHSDVVSDDDEHGEPVSFRPVPRMIVDVNSNSASALSYGGVPMVEVIAQQRGLISMDGSVDIMIPSLVRYEADKAARTHVKEVLGDHQATRNVDSLFRAFSAESDTGYQDLKNIAKVRSLARYIESAESGNSAVFEAVSSMLMNRSVMLTGSKGASTGDDLRFVEGIVVDVIRYDALDDRQAGTYVAVRDKQDGDLHEILLSSVESIAF
jgi:hypothetical protein